MDLRQRSLHRITAFTFPNYVEEQKLWLKALHGVQGSTKSVKIPAGSINVCMVRFLCSRLLLEIVIIFKSHLLKIWKLKCNIFKEIGVAEIDANETATRGRFRFSDLHQLCCLETCIFRLWDEVDRNGCFG